MTEEALEALEASDKVSITAKELNIMAATEARRQSFASEQQLRRYTMEIWFEKLGLQRYL